MTEGKETETKKVKTKEKCLRCGNGKKIKADTESEDTQMMLDTKSEQK